MCSEAANHSLTSSVCTTQLLSAVIMLIIPFASESLWTSRWDVEALQSHTCQLQGSKPPCDFIQIGVYAIVSLTEGDFCLCLYVMLTLDFVWSVRPLVCEDIQADVEDGQLQFFYVLAFVLQGDTFTCS